MNDVRETYANYYMPFVIEQTARGERSYDIYSRLLKERHHLCLRSDRGYRGDAGDGPVAVS